MAEITAEVELPRSTVYEIVQTLVSLKCLRPSDKDGHRYELGLHLFELGSAYADSVELAEQGQLVAHELVAQSGETAVGKALLAKIRDRQLAFDNCEASVDVCCVAAPVRDASARVIAGISISVPVHRADQLEEEIAGYVAEGARSLSTRLGYRNREGSRRNEHNKSVLGFTRPVPWGRCRDRADGRTRT